MKTHAERGMEAIRQLEPRGEHEAFLKYAELTAGSHHEKWNGEGYPHGLQGEEIPLLGRMMAVADVYDALTSARPYKEPLSTAESARIILEGAGTHFDPALVEAFGKLEPEFAQVARNKAGDSLN